MTDDVCLFRVWSLGEARLQLSVRTSRDEQPPPPPRHPSIRHLEQEVAMLVMCDVCVSVCDRDTDGNFIMHFSQ